MIANNCQAKCAVFNKEIPKVSFVFLRHGSTDWAIEKVREGFVDYELNDKGRVEAELAAKVIQTKLINPIFYCSTLVRAVQTCSIARSFGGANEVFYIKDLRGREYGDVRLIFPQIMQLSKENNLGEIEALLPESAEKKDAFNFRCLNALYEILSNHQKRCQNIIIVSHEEVFRCFTEYLVNQSLPIEKGGMRLLEFNGEKWLIKDIEK